MQASRLLPGAAAAAVVLVAALPAAAATPTLKGSVGPGFTIALPKKPTKAGKYAFVISDKSSIHDFHLVGPGVNKKLTSLDGTGVSKALTLTLKKGTYRFFCDLHPTMTGSFRIR